MATKPMLASLAEEGKPELVLPWNTKTFEMMNKARLDVIQRNKNKFADVQAEGLKEYYENRGGWQKFGETLISLLKGAGFDPGDDPPGPPPDMPGVKNNTPVADISKDYDFLQEVHKLAGETGAKPSELMAMYHAESGGIKPEAKNPDSGATGLFQLMFNTADPTSKRYGYTRDEFTKLSRGDQVRIHRQYLKDAGFFDQSQRGIQAVKIANIGPAFLGMGLDEPMYRKGSREYERNKEVDTIYGNNDGVITARDYIEFVRQTGGQKNYAKYDDPATTLDPSTAAAATAKPISDIPEKNQLGQGIKENFGMDTNDSRFFEVPGYGKIEAYKTTKGFDFFKNGTKLSMHPSRPQAKAIYEYFIKTNGGQKLDGNEQSSSLLQKSQNYSTRNLLKPPYEVSYVNVNPGGAGGGVDPEFSEPLGISRNDLVSQGLSNMNPTGLISS